MFPKDKILTKMILDEFKVSNVSQIEFLIIITFKDLKVIKMPDEYDLYDSDEEEKIKGRFTREP